MLFIRRLLVVGLLSVGIIAATTAQAGNQLFTGSWTVKSFGNERVGGTGFSEFYSAWAMPQGVQCNALWPRCPFNSTPWQTIATGTLMGQKGFHPLGGLDPKAKYSTAPPAQCIPWSKWGTGAAYTGGGTATMRPAKGMTLETTMGNNPIPPLYRNYKFFTASTPSAQPNATYCNATSTRSGGFPAKTTGLPYNGKGLIQEGAPVIGSWTAVTTAAGNFSFPAAPVQHRAGMRIGQGTRTPLGDQGSARSGTFGDFQNIYPYVYSYTYATLRNDVGVFGVGQGPGDFSATYGGGDATIKIQKGFQRFGGTMKMLGALTTKVCYFRQGGCSLGGQDWQYDAVGASANLTTTGTGTGASTMLKSGFETFDTAMYYHTALMQVSTIQVEGERFPWTTGAVTVLATGRGPHKTVHYAKGYDNRNTATGKGTIQLVTPVLTRWLQPCCNWETGGIGILRIKFVPEPQTWALLVAGISLLGVGYRMRGR